MKYIFDFLLGIAVGYLIVEKVMPYYQAKVEAFDLDDVWERWDSEEWM